MFRELRFLVVHSFLGKLDEMPLLIEGIQGHINKVNEIKA